MSTDLAGRTVAVLGAAKSGVAAANLLSTRGVSVVLSDLRSEEALADHLTGLEPGVRVVTGRNVVEDVDLVVTSPGVPPGATPLRRALEAGTPVWSEPELAFRLCPGTVVAITGTDGKSTVTTMISHVLEDAGRTVWVGGNLGTPFCDAIYRDQVPQHGRAVVEISCFHLEYVDAFRPRIAVLLNIAADHLDVHGGMERYAAAKARLFARQGAGDTAVYNADDPRCVAPALEAAGRGARTVPFTADPRAPLVAGLSLDALGLPGVHNIANALACQAACEADGLSISEVAAALQSYRPLPHRIELVADIDGVRWIDDSKATNPHAAAAGLRAVGAGPVILLCGGVDKGLDLAPLAEASRGRVRSALVFGQIQARMAAALGGSANEVSLVPDLAAAVQAARGLSRPGDTVLLGPACSSFDQFVSYAARGEAFQSLVQGH